MNAAAASAPLEQFALENYPTDARDLESEARARRRVSLTSFVSPFVKKPMAVFSGIWNLIVAVINRVARAFGLQANMPQAGDVRDPSMAMASLEGKDGSEASRQAVDEAAREVVKDLSQTVRELLALKPNEAKIMESGGRAYLALRLSEIGGAVVDLREAVRAKELQLKELIAPVAERIGGSVDEILDLMQRSSLADPESLRDFGREALAVNEEFRELKQQVESSRWLFCEYASAGLQAARLGGRADIAPLVRTKMAQFADQEMAEYILAAEAAVAEGEGKENADKLASVDVNSANRETSGDLALAVGQRPDQSVSKSSRAARFGSGIDDLAEPPEGGAGANASPAGVVAAKPAQSRAARFGTISDEDDLPAGFLSDGESGNQAGDDQPASESYERPRGG